LDIYINIIMSIIDEFDDDLDTDKNNVKLDKKDMNKFNLNEEIKKLKKEMSKMDMKELQSIVSQKANLLNETTKPKDKLKEKLKAMKLSRNKK